MKNKKIKRSVAVLLTLTMALSISGSVGITGFAEDGNQTAKPMKALGISPYATEPTWAVTLTAATAADLQTKINTATNAVPTLIELENVCTMATNVQLNIPNNKVIKLTGYSLIGNGTGVINVEDGGTLYLASIKLTNGNSNNGGGVMNKGTLFLLGGGEISGNTASDKGGGVYNADAGTFTVDGGTISGNEGITSSGRGSGVYNEGTFTMNDGTISGNTSTANNGGGVYNYKDNVVAGIFTMNGGTISENTAAAGGGGGVYNSDGILTINGGSISKNIAQNGGGVYSSLGVFTINGGTISENTATLSGGGIFSYRGVNFIINDGSIFQNNARSTGGIQLFGGNLTMYGGTISQNTASANGGGINIVNSSGQAIFTMEDGTISGNKVTGTDLYHGGGVNNNGTFTMNGGTISGNTARNHGSGILNAGIFTISKGVISENTTDKDGGGVYNLTGTFTMEGGTISANIAGGDGGGVYNSMYFINPHFTMEDGTISDNAAGGDGGGIWHNGTTDLKIKKGSITNNRAGNDGGGIWVSYANLAKVDVLAEAAFSGNKAVKSTMIQEADKATHIAHILTTDFTTPFVWAYNNYDIAYPRGTETRTITYQVAAFGGGTIGPPPSEAVAIGGSPIHIPDAIPDTNFYFGGWYLNKAVTAKVDMERWDVTLGATITYTAGQTIPAGTWFSSGDLKEIIVTEDLIATANFYYQSWYIGYHAGSNGAIGLPNYEWVRAGDSPILVPGTIPDTNYSFIGWTIDRDVIAGVDITAGGTTYLAGTPIPAGVLLQTADLEQIIVTDEFHATANFEAKDIGNLTVSKTVMGDAKPPADTEFTFTLKKGGVVVDDFDYTIGGGASKSAVNGTFILKDGETATILNLDGAADYVVAESKPAAVDKVTITTVSKVGNGSTKDGLISDPISVSKTEAGSVVFTNLYDKNTIPTPNDPKLSVVKKADKATVKPGDKLSYTITVTNKGKGDAKDIVIKDYLPKYTTYDSSTPKGELSKENGKDCVTWKIASLKPGKTFKISLTVLIDKDIPKGHTIKNTVSYNWIEEEETITGTSNTAVVKYDGKPQTGDVGSPSLLLVIAVAAVLLAAAMAVSGLWRRRKGCN